MDEKQLIMATLKLHELSGDLIQEAENLVAQAERLDMACYELFSKLNPLDSTWVDGDTWDEFKQQIINFCEGAKQ
jgi:hypothetical protein